MSTEIAKKSGQAVMRSTLMVDSLSDVRETAAMYLESGMVPKHWTHEKGNLIPVDVAKTRLAIAFVAGKEVGFQSYQECLSNMYVVNNIPTVYGSGNNILIERSGKMRGVVRNSWDPVEQEWVLTIKKDFGGGSISEVTTKYGEKQVTAAGHAQRNTNYKKFMREMCERKCWARMYQIHFPGGIASYEYMDHEPEVQAQYAEEAGDFDPAIMDGMSKEGLVNLAVANPDYANVINEKIRSLDTGVIQDVEAEEVPEVTDNVPVVFDNLKKTIIAGVAGKIKSKHIGIPYVTADEATYSNGLSEADAKDMLDHLIKRVKVIKDAMKDPEMWSQIISEIGFEISDYATGEQVRFFSEEAQA